MRKGPTPLSEVQKIEVPVRSTPAGPFANDWYTSPLDDPRIATNKPDWDLARMALDWLPHTIARAQVDYRALFAFLQDNRQLPEYLMPEEDEEEEDKNPFYGT
jgi:hypothetical protein